MSKQAGWTSKPCDGCGKAGHKIGEVCLSCQKLMEDGRELRRQREAGAGQKVEVKLAWHHPTYPDAQSVKGRQEREALDQAMQDLTRTLGERLLHAHPFSPKREHLFPAQPQQHGHTEHFYLFPVVFVEALRKLDVALQAALVSTYLAGRARGSDLLGQLASGEITVSQFDQKTFKEPS